MVRKRPDSSSTKRKRASKETEEAEESRNAKSKGTVAITKDQAAVEWCKHLESEEGETVYKVARTIQRFTQDIGDIDIINDKNGNISTEPEEVKVRRKESFDCLLYTNNPHGKLTAESSPIEGSVTTNKVKTTLKKMKKRAVGDATRTHRREIHLELMI